MSRGHQRGLVVVAGATASGKSDLALALARRFGGTIVNADSMQVYRELAILTARPALPALARAPHRLYGVLPAADPCSAARWAALALAAIAAAEAADSLPIVVGGTGLYLSALAEGLSPVPEVQSEVRSKTREVLNRIGPEAAWRELARRDPATAASLRPADRQRIARALEVLEATGRPLSEWQALPRTGGYGGPILALVLAPPRPTIHARCEARLTRMVARGVFDEVAAFLGLGLDPELPAMKTVGLRELGLYVRGRASAAEARARALQATRQYAKRQTTWLRHRPRSAVRIEGRPEAAATAEVARFVELTVRG